MTYRNLYIPSRIFLTVCSISEETELHRRIRPRFWLFVIGVMVITFAIAGIAMNQTLRSNAAKLTELSEQRVSLSEERENLMDTYDFIQTDEYVIRTARSVLGMLMPNEVRYVSSSD